jgi:histidyl-tRNA synthetase
MAGTLFQAPKGTRDVLPEDAPYWAFVETTARRQVQLANYVELRTPMFEQTGVFLKGVGGSTDIAEHEMYTFLDKSNESMALRPESTAAVMRAYLQNGMSSRPQPVKLFTIAQNFRYATPQEGRLREFNVLDAEVIGEADAMVDAELVGLQWRLYRELGLRELSLQINSIGDPVCRPGYIDELRAYFTQHETALCEDCRRRLKTNPLRLLDCKVLACQPILSEAPRSVDHLCEPCRAHFEAWKSYMSVAELPFVVNPRLVRGLDYYTRSVWEVWPPVVGGQSTIGGGGRYDGLAELLGGRPTPGVGFATGIERIILELRNQRVAVPPLPGPRVYLACQSESAKVQAFRLAELLRANGIAADLAFGDRKLGKQLAAADRSGAQFALILGETEVANSTVTVKDLRDGQGQQSEIAQQELVVWLSDRTEREYAAAQ